jgi:hypothetical protein
VSADLVGTVSNEVELLAGFRVTMRDSCAVSSRVECRCEYSEFVALDAEADGAAATGKRRKS